MFKRLGVSAFLFLLSISALTSYSWAQQTLGGITGAVSDSTGGVLSDTVVTAVADQTGLTRTAKTNASGSYLFSNLPIGTYTITFVHEGFDTQKVPSIPVQADRTATVNAQLQVGQVSTSVTVEESPLMNAVDTTNGYVLDKQQIDSIPLPTGSFTGLAILSPGVNAELPGGTGSNSGLGNAPIWANGQRDTSNSFPAEWCRRQQPLQRQEHQPGDVLSRCEQYRRQRLERHNQRRRRAECVIGLSLHRQCNPHACTGDAAGGPRQRFDVRRAAGLGQRRAHRHEHRIGHQCHPRQSLRPPRH